MGRRSINTTKSGKYMNPTDQARKEARKKELKKNKKQRMMVRQAVLKGKDPLKILQEMEIIDQMEFNTTEAPKLNEKVLKDKRRKLKETFTRVMKLYEKENPDFARDLRKQEYEYDKKRMELQVHYEQVKNAERVQLDQIPLPDAPQNAANIPLPNEIPLPLLGEPVMPHSILKRSSVFGERETTLVELEIARRRPPPGPPPEAPPELSDSEDEEYDPAKGIEENIGAVSMDTDHLRPKSSDRENNQSHKSRKIRWDDDETRDPGEEEKDTRLKFGSRARGKGVTPLQAKMLKLAGQDAPREDKGSGKSRSRSSSDSSDSDSDHERSHDRRRERDRRGRDRDREHRKDRNKDEKEKAVDSEMMPDVAPPGEEGTEEDTEVGTRLVPPGPPPGAPPSLPPGAPPGPPPGAPMMMFRPPPLGAAPPGPPPRLLPPGPPPGRPSGLPPGPPPGLPPNIRMPPRMPHAPPTVPPPRVLRPPGTAPALAPPGVPLPPGVSAPNPNVLSAPPSITKKPQGPGGEDKNRATIEAKPQIKHLIGDVTRFTPTALKVKREAKGMKGSTKTTAKEDERRSHQQMAAPANPHGKTKDDAYDQFMREMQGLF